MKTNGILTFLFALIVVCCIAPNKAQAASVDDLEFSLNDDGKSYNVYCNYDIEGELTIPATYNGKPVTRIPSSAFATYFRLTKVTIPDSVTTIDDQAFWACSGLTEVIIGNSVTSIGEKAFYDCFSLTRVNIPDSVTAIDNYAFQNCTSLTSVNIPEGVTSIGYGAFYKCEKLASITIPDSVTYINSDTFFECYNLADVTIGDGVTTIGDYAFYNCSSLTSVDIPDSVTTIGSSAFELCTSLTYVTIGNSVTAISANTFAMCDNLTSVTVPNSVTTIGDSAFDLCFNLADVYYTGTQEQWNALEFNEYFNAPLLHATIHFNSYCPGDHTEQIIPGKAATCTKTGLTDGKKCSVCGKILVTQEETPAIGHIEEIIPNAEDTSSGTGLTIGKKCSVCGIILARPHQLTFALNDDNASYSVIGFNYDDSGELFIPSSYNSKPVTSIGDSAFYAHWRLNAVTIPDSVITIGKNAFRSCDYLSRVSIGNGVITIGDYAFSTCYNLSSVTISNSVATIGDYAFSTCYNLSSVTISNSVATIGNYAFECCFDLTDVYYIGTQQQWKAIKIGHSNEALQSATIHFVDPCVSGHTEEIIPAKTATCTETGLTEGKKCSVCGEILVSQDTLPTTKHTFDNAEDASCSNCTYMRLTADAINLDVFNKLTVVDNEEANNHHRAVVYFLGEQSVDNITDEAALKAIDAGAKTHWGLTSINKVQLKDNGNYVVHIHYNEGTGAKQTVAKAFTVNIAKPSIEMNGHKVTVTAGDSSCTNYRATVYSLGENTVEELTDETALKALAISAKTYWGLKDINRIQLLENGNYVILLHYNIGTSAKQTVAKAVTMNLSEVTLDVVNGKLLAADPGSNYIHHRAVVYYLGEESSIENAITTKTYWNLSSINKVQLSQPGNYVILLHYNLPDSAKMTVTAQVTI